MTITPEARAALRLALFHLVETWDALRDIESELGFDLETNDISGAAVNLNGPEDANDLDDEAIDEILNGLAEGD